MFQIYSDKRWFFISFALHLIVVLAILVSGFIYRLMSKYVYVSNGVGETTTINVDVVGLPNVLKKDLAELNKETKKEETKTEAEMSAVDQEKNTNKKKDFISKIKESVDKEQNYLKKIKIIKGLKVQKAGEGSEGPNTEQVDPYFQTIKQYVKTYWKVPKWIKPEGLNVLVLVKISEDGSISEPEVSSSSGNTEFDGLALSAVKSAAPFPAPPISLRDSLQNGVILSFP